MSLQLILEAVNGEYVRAFHKFALFLTILCKNPTLLWKDHPCLSGRTIACLNYFPSLPSHCRALQGQILYLPSCTTLVQGRFQHRGISLKTNKNITWCEQITTSNSWLFRLYQCCWKLPWASAITGFHHSRIDKVTSNLAMAGKMGPWHLCCKDVSRSSVVFYSYHPLRWAPEQAFGPPACKRPAQSYV